MSIDMSSPRSSLVKTALGYSAMIGGTVLLFLWIRTQGLELAAPPPVSEERSRSL